MRDVGTSREAMLSSSNLDSVVYTFIFKFSVRLDGSFSTDMINLLPTTTVVGGHEDSIVGFPSSDVNKQLNTSMGN